LREKGEIKKEEILPVYLYQKTTTTTTTTTKTSKA